MCAAITITATVDLLHLESKLPDSDLRCNGESATCLNGRLSESLARDRAAEPLQAQYAPRAWVYAFGILAVTAAGTAWALPRRPRTEWLGIFTDLGVIGVWEAIG